MNLPPTEGATNGPPEQLSREPTTLPTTPARYAGFTAPKVSTSAVEQAANLDRARGRRRGGTYTRVLLVGNVATAQRGFSSRAGECLRILNIHNRRSPIPEAAVAPAASKASVEAPELTTRTETPVPYRSSE